MAAVPDAPILTSLNYLFSHEGKRVVAHCLELDLVTSGDSIDDSETSLNALVLVQIRTCYAAGNWAQLRQKAPFAYWQLLEGAKSLGQSHLEVEVPPIVLPVERKVTLPVVRFERQGELVAA